MNFNFILQTKGNAGQITIKLKTENHGTFLVPTFLKIKPEMWDVKKRRPKNIYLKTSKKINSQLNRIAIILHDFCKKNHICTVDLLEKLQKDVLKSIRKDSFSFTRESLLFYVYQYIQKRIHLISDATKKRYMVFLRLLERFEGFSLKRIYLKDVNAQFVKDFLNFGKIEMYSSSTIRRTICFVRTILNFLEKRGTRTFVYELELPKEQAKNTAYATLTTQELKAIAEVHVPDTLKAAKEWLLISCYCGQRVSDFLRFNRATIKEIEQQLYFSFIQQKTGRRILMPVHPIIREILQRNNNRFPSFLPASQYNIEIKHVARLAHLNTDITVNKRVGHRSQIMHIPKWQAVSSHIGRRSFASNYYGKIPTSLLMEATGHSTETMFRRYINNGDTARAKLLSNYFEQEIPTDSFNG